MTAMCGIDGCIYVSGHGGEHFTPTDGLDHSDDIRIRPKPLRRRILRDRVHSLAKDLVDLKITAADLPTPVESYPDPIEPCDIEDMEEEK